MFDLLTQDEYRAIADGLTPATTSFVDGSFRRAKSGATFDTVNPATGAVIASIAACDADTLGRELKWERSRGGALFPHLYASLPMDLITRHWWLARGADGAYCLPDDLCA